LTTGGATPVWLSAVEGGYCDWDDVTAQKKAFQEAIDEGTWRVPALLGLAQLLWWEEDDIDAAIETYRRAIDEAASRWRADALISMASLLARKERYDEAEAALREALTQVEAQDSTRALLELGDILRSRDDLEGAIEVYWAAADAADPEAGPQARFRLAETLRQTGSLDDAEHEFRRVADADNESLAQSALLHLASLLEQRGDVAGAQAALRAVVDSDDGPLGMQALTQLRRMLIDQDDVAAADRVYEDWRRRNETESTSLSYQVLGNIFREAGDLAGAKDAFGRAVAVDDYWGRASIHELGRVLMALDERDEAVEVWLKAIDAGDANNVGSAGAGLRELLLAAGPGEWSRSVYRRVLATGHEPIGSFLREFDAEEFGGGLTRS